MSEVIAERSFTNAVGDPITVRWFKPEPDQNDWRCEYAIQLRDTEPKVRRALGVDSAQALVLALNAAATYLSCAENDPALEMSKVHWFDPNDDLGLPVTAEYLREGRRGPTDPPPAND